MDRKELIQQIKEKQSFLCVGLDTDINKIPQCIIDEAKSHDGDTNPIWLSMRHTEWTV